MTKAIATSETRSVVKYGYAINVSPATNCGQRCCFRPYTNSTNPIPAGMSDRNSHVGSRNTMSVSARKDPYAFGTKARNRRGLSTRIFRIVSSGTPANRSFGTNCMSTDAQP